MEKSNVAAYPGSTNSSAAATENAVLRGVDQAASTLHNTIDKVADPARHGVDRAAAAAHSTVDKLANGAGTATSKFGAQAHRLTEAPLQAVDYSKAYIKDHPLQAVGGALLLGMLVGRLTASRY